MENYLSVNAVMFTVVGYPMSYIEFFGTLFNIWSVWLVAKNKILTWPVGIVAVILFMFLFYQIQLYSDFIEQIYFLLTGFYGWWVWTKGRVSKTKDMPITQESLRNKQIYVGAIVLGTLLLGYLMSNIHTYLPSLFPVAASFAYLDAFTTVLSFAATILLAYKKLETWYLWILVDIIGIVLYYVKEVKFVSLLYVLFLILAINGYLSWKKELTNGSRLSHQ